MKLKLKDKEQYATWIMLTKKTKNTEIETRLNKM